MRSVLVGCAGLAVVLTLLPLLRSPYWWIRMWDFPRIQIAIVALVAVVGLAWLGSGWKDRALMAAAFACLFFQAYRIYPYTSLAAEEGICVTARPGEPTLRIMVANIQMENRDAQSFLKTVTEAQPDLLLVAEVDNWWHQQLSVLEDYPHRVCYPLENTYGLSLYSKLELESPEVRFLVEDNIPSIFTIVQWEGGEFDFVGVHPRPPQPLNNTEERDAELVLVGRLVEQSGRPSIVAGDLNDVAWSHTTRLFRRISSLIDPRIGRGFYNTFHARIPFLRFPIDHIFYDESFQVVNIDRLPAGGSDHFPVFLELVQRPQLANEQDAPEPDRQDHREAEELITKAGNGSGAAEGP